MEDAGRGRGRNVPVGRGAQLLAALQAKTRAPGADPPVAAPVAVPLAVEPVEGIPGTSRGRAMAIQLALAKRKESGVPGSEVHIPCSSSQTPTTFSSPPTTAVPLGRGMMARLKTLGLATAASTSSPSGGITEQFQSLQPPSGFKESKMCELPPEKPKIVKMGETGTKMPIVANYVRLHMDKNKGIFEYEVRFEPSIDSKDMRFKLLKQHQEAIGTAKTFDGVTLYLPFQFPNNVTSFQSTHPVTDEPVTVRIIFHRKRRPEDSVHFYNVLIRRIARILGMVQMKRNYFNPHSPIIIPAEKLQLWPGLATAVNEFEDGLMLCCDVSFRVLRTTTVLDELVEMSKNRATFSKTATDTLIGLSILTRYNNKMYRIDDILFDKNPMSTFDLRGEPVTFVEYYKKQYDIEIKDKGQPLLLHRARKKRLGKEEETELICLIPELSFLTGIDDRMRSNMATMRNLATHTRVPPMEREKALQNYINSVNNNEKAKNILAEWGLTLADACLGLEGRVLESERILLGRSAFQVNAQCDWGRNLMADVLVPVKIDFWILVCTDRDSLKAQDFTKVFMEVAPKMGMKVAPPKLLTLPNDRTDTYVSRIREELNPQLQLVVCVFPTARDDRYSAVKTLCTAQYAFPSQCINARTISNPTKLRSVVQKIALQINCKNGGELWAVNIPTKTLMVCGVDVYHDPSHKNPSVVGFVASVNSSITRWYSRAKFQQQGVELVATLKLCLIESLKKYYEMNHDYPKQIVLFRDGVGDGQLPFVVEHEVPQLLSAFQAVVPPFEPKFTMVVIQKRINARFFRPSANGQANPLPGTVIDHTVTRRDWWDYYLVSQHVSQGTVSPTHYIVAYDGGMKPDNLQKLTYKMTHMYYNWPGTIRVPAPCQYAHKLAFLVGENIRKDVKEELSNRLYFL